MTSRFFAIGLLVLAFIMLLFCYPTQLNSSGGGGFKSGFTPQEFEMNARAAGAGTGGEGGSLFLDWQDIDDTGTGASTCIDDAECPIYSVPPDEQDTCPN